MLRTLSLLGHNPSVSQEASVIAIFSLTPEAGDADGCFADMMGYKNKT